MRIMDLEGMAGGMYGKWQGITFMVLTLNSDGIKMADTTRTTPPVTVP